MTASDTGACDLPPKQRHIGGLREHAEACLRERYAAAILGLIAGWFEDYNDNHSHSGLKMQSLRKFIAAQTVTA